MRITRVPPERRAWAERQLGESHTLHPSASIIDCELGRWTDVGPGCRLERVELGDYSYLHEHVDAIDCRIGRFCSIASHVRLNPGDHPMARPMQHHAGYRRDLYGMGDDDRDFFAWRRARAVSLGHDVWLGHASLVMAGITVGSGAVVAANAVVTRDVEPFTIVAGVPARPLRRRFPDAICERLLAIAWWDWDHGTIAARMDGLCGSIEDFVARWG